jgi:hypothetical protein
MAREGTSIKGSASSSHLRIHFAKSGYDVLCITSAEFRIHKNTSEPVNDVNCAWATARTISNRLAPLRIEAGPCRVNCRLVFDTGLYGLRSPNRTVD